MGFGSGYSHKSNNGGKRYSNDMTAHVWNAGRETEGQSSNGNLYFKGATIFSYGTHYALAYRMPDGLVILNSCPSSVTTNGHKSDVRSAIKDRAWVHFNDLTDIAGAWKLLPALADYLNAAEQTAEHKGEMQKRVRAALLAHAEQFENEIYAAGAESGRWNRETSKHEALPGSGELGAYIAALVGLPVASWPKIKRDAAKARADAAAANAARDLADATARALRLSDMSDRYFREQLATAGQAYNTDSLKSYGTELRRARKLMLAAKRGPLAAKSRLAIVRDRIKQVDAKVASYDAMYEQRKRGNALAVRLANLRNWRDATTKQVDVHTLINLSRDAQWVAAYGRTSALRASAATLAHLANEGADAIRLENERLRLIERENAAKAEAEREALWLAGEPVGRINFDAATGGAALRVVGDELQTSHGATVPLAHAVKVFRFVKLCRDKGETWRRNGATIRVGHFQVDRIDATGDFTAGCHFISWPEVERVAKQAGVFDCAPSADAIEHTHA